MTETSEWLVKMTENESLLQKLSFKESFTKVRLFGHKISVRLVSFSCLVSALFWLVSMIRSMCTASSCLLWTDWTNIIWPKDQKLSTGNCAVHSFQRFLDLINLLFSFLASAYQNRFDCNTKKPLTNFEWSKLQFEEKLDALAADHCWTVFIQIYFFLATLLLYFSIQKI